MSADSTILRFGPYQLDASRLELRRDDRLVRIQARPLALLRYLALHADRVVTHDEILQHVWSGVRVEPGALKSAIHALRRALGPGASGADAESSWIASVHGRGYRFVGPLARAPRGGNRAPDPGPARVLAAGDFIAREGELEILHGLCAAALRGESRIALIGGAPGVGKTRLAMELARAAEPLGFETRIGRTLGGAGTPPFWPWAQIVRGWALSQGAERLAEIAGAPSHAAELLGLAPARDRSGLPTSYTTSVRQRFRILERVSRFLERASLERPQLLILDDLHRADPASLELLAFLSEHLMHARLLLVATHRPLDPGHPLGRVLQRPATCSISLFGLARSSVAQVLERSFGRKPAPETVERVHARSGGNPLFVHELARAGAAGMALEALPSRIHDAVRARIGECSPACLRLLSLAAVPDVEITLPLLREALGAELQAGVLLEALDEAERRDLLICSGGAYRFVHGLVRETLRVRLGPAEQAQLGVQIGDALAALYGGRVAALPRPHLAAEHAGATSA